MAQHKSWAAQEDPAELQSHVQRLRDTQQVRVGWRAAGARPCRELQGSCLHSTPPQMAAAQFERIFKAVDCPMPNVMGLIFGNRSARATSTSTAVLHSSTRLLPPGGTASNTTQPWLSTASQAAVDMAATLAEAQPLSLFQTSAAVEWFYLDEAGRVQGLWWQKRSVPPQD